VHIVTRRHLSEAMERYPDAANEIKAWFGIVEAIRWHNFAEVRSMFKDADLVDGYVIFNIRQNQYRLITVVHYSKTIDEKQTEGHVYIRSFLTHKEYDNRNNWDRSLEQNEPNSRKPGGNDRERRSPRHTQRRGT
jgi:mRNA interferase HigB